MKTFKTVILLLFTLVIFGNCNNGSSDLDFFGYPKKLVIGSYEGDNPDKTQAAFEPFRAYLEKKLGVEVSFYFTSNYADIITALRAKKIQMAHLTPYNYVLATQQMPGLAAIATLGTGGKPTVYHSIILTNPKTGLKTMADVKARAKDLTLCFADPASASGHLIPRAYLNSIGLNPDSSFKETMFAGSHNAVIMTVKAGKMDLGCTNSDLALDLLIQAGSLKREDVVTLWTSPAIPNDAITVRTDMNKDFIEKVQDAYLSASKDDFKAFSPYVKLYWPHPEVMSYIAAADGLYSQLRNIASKTKYIK